MKRNLTLGVVALVALLSVTWYLMANRQASDVKSEARLTNTTSAPTAETKPAPTTPPPATDTAKVPVTTTTEKSTTTTATTVAKAKAGKKKGGKSRRVVKVTKNNGATTGTSSSTGVRTSQTGGPANDNVLDGSLIVGHLGAFGANTRNMTEIAGEIGYRFGKNRVAILQEARKLYLIAPQGESELLLADSVISHEYELSPNFLTFKVKSIAGVTLPLSSESRRVKHITRPTVGFTASREFFNGRVSFEWTPTFNYFLNTYGTSPESVPLRQMAFGNKAELGLHFLDKRLRLAGWAKWFHSSYQEFDDSKTSPSGTDSIEYGTYVDYRITGNISAQGGYVRGSSMLRNALLDAPFYDPHVSRVYGAVTVSF